MSGDSFGVRVMYLFKTSMFKNFGQRGMLKDTKSFKTNTAQECGDKHIIPDFLCGHMWHQMKGPEYCCFQSGWVIV